MDEKRNNLIVILHSIASHRRMITINVLIITILALLISLILPKWYRATVVILPPEKSESLTDLAISMGLKSMAMGGGGFALPMMASPSDLLAAIAESRTVAERVVDSLDLIKVFKVKSKEQAIKITRAQTKVHVRAEGIIEISFVAKNRNLVAQAANATARELDNINRSHNTQSARDLKNFVEAELEKNAINLRQAEDALQEFQRKYKALALDKQTEASIQAAADLYGQLTLEQINLKVMQRTHAPDHPDVLNLKFRISEIEKGLAQLQEGFSNPRDSALGLLAIPFDNLPELALRYLQLMRDLKKEESVYEVLTAQYEQAKIMEAKNTPTISILDAAVTPLTKYKPKRAYIVLTGMILSLVFSIILAVLVDRWREFKTTNPEKYKIISGLLQLLRRDLFGLKRQGID